MSRTRRSVATAARLGTVAVVALITVGALAACTSGGKTPASSSPATDAPATTQPAPSESADPTPTIIAFTIDCNVLLPDSVVTMNYPDLTADPSHKALSGFESEVVKRKGTVCGWSNGADQSLSVAVAQMTEADLNAIKNRDFDTNAWVPTYGGDGYFRVTAAGGEAEYFSGQYWIIVTSTEFEEPGDVTPIMGEIVANLS